MSLPLPAGVAGVTVGDVIVRRLPWIGVLLTLATAAVLLFGPLWDDARGENPMTRDTSPERNIELALPLALPALLVALAVLAAVALPTRRVLAVLAAGVAVWVAVTAPAPVMPVMLPGIAVVALGAVLGSLRSGARPA